MATASIHNPNGPSGRIITEGDTITSFRGEDWTFIKVSRYADEGRQAKVLVKSAEGDHREFYLSVFPGLRVEEA